MHRALSLPDKARSTDRYISTQIVYGISPNHEKYFEPRQEGYAQLGLEALELAEYLREEYGFIDREKSERAVVQKQISFLREKAS